MTHPLDIKYIGEMLPNISADILEKQKVLQPGTCVCFGSAFKVPMIVKLEMPDPMPFSSNCDVSGCWKPGSGSAIEVTPTQPLTSVEAPTINVEAPQVLSQATPVEERPQQENVTLTSIEQKLNNLYNPGNIQNIDQI